jgi:hypothetical protein
MSKKSDEFIQRNWIGTVPTKTETMGMAESIQDQKRVSQKEPIFEVTVKMKNGEEMDINPVVNITIDNTYHEYDFDPREIESITFKEVEL